MDGRRGEWRGESPQYLKLTGLNIAKRLNPKKDITK
jgi:hypothetical protein